MTEITEVFWVVMSDNSFNCGARYKSESSARAEAKRGALIAPAVMFFVLSCTGAMKCGDDDEVRWIEANLIPF